KTSIDELPQLWNIFRGNMSVIGPRPALWNQDYLTAERDKYGANDVKPGLTGLAQISGRDELEIEEKAKLDGVYAKELSKSSFAGFRMDMKMFFGSIFSVMKSEGVVEGGTGALVKKKVKTVQLDMSDYTGDNVCDTVKNEEYKVSIIMPAYNAEKYISEAIESVLAQTYNNWELIVVDDCSKDSTAEIIKKMCDYDSRIKFIQHTSNQGVSATRNTALDIATGDFIAFLDADDKWLKNKLEQQLDFMIKNDYVLTYTDYQKFDSNSGTEGKTITCPTKMTEKDIYKNTAIACLTVMINRKKVGAFHMPNLSHTEDQITWQEILKRGYIAYGLNEKLSMYRVGNQSLTSNQTSSAKKQWQTYRNYYGFSIPRSTYYFCCYALNALKKHFL
ncbi:MAG: glycosyltransferase, partial [Lachnospiraceae bacterium]|nr:glycosyltransferase [Lachnospiraceae bacterium]